MVVDQTLISPPGAGGSAACTVPQPMGAQVCNFSSQTNSQSDFGTSNNTTQTCTLMLTAITCSELIPQLTNIQVEREVKYFETFLGKPLLTRSAKKSISNYKAALKSLFDTQITNNFDDILESCSNKNEAYDSAQVLIDKISCTIKELDDQVALINNNISLAQEHINQNNPNRLVTPIDTEVSHSLLPDVTLCEPITIHDNTPINFNFDDILNSIKFSKTGKRKTAYFGHVGYEYTGAAHAPAEFPNLECFKTMTEYLRSAVPEFENKKYTCLATLLESGEEQIPKHSDNETRIKTGSNIYTFSVGAERAIRFCNKIGPLTEVEHKLPHGSVYSMSQESQSQWEHCIPRDPAIKSPRISFVWRELIDKIDDPTVSIPKIHEPPMARPEPKIKPKKKRVLLLTDSLQSNFPTHMFPDNYVCIKKIMYELCDIDQYEREFHYTDYVVISSGINDLSRYGRRAPSLIDTMAPRFASYSEKFKNCTFIFNSLLSTSRVWLNQATQIFNNYMFRLSLQQENLWFLDFASLLHRTNFLNTRGNGIHITLQAQRVFTNILTTCIPLFDRPVPDIRQLWPLRPQYRQSAALYRNSIHRV